MSGNEESLEIMFQQQEALKVRINEEIHRRFSIKTLLIFLDYVRWEQESGNGDDYVMCSVLGMIEKTDLDELVSMSKDFVTPHLSFSEEIIFENMRTYLKKRGYFIDIETIGMAVQLIYLSSNGYYYR